MVYHVSGGPGGRGRVNASVGQHMLALQRYTFCPPSSTQTGSMNLRDMNSHSVFYLLQHRHAFHLSLSPMCVPITTYDQGNVT